MANCKRCNKKLGIFSDKRKVGNSLLCTSCFSEISKKAEKEKQAENAKEAKSAAKDKAIISEIVVKYVTRIANSGDLLHVLRIKDWPYQVKKGGVLYADPVDRQHLEIMCAGYDVDFDVKGDPLFYENGVIRSLNALRYEIDEEMCFWEGFLSGEQDAEHWYYTLHLIHIPPEEIEPAIEMLKSQKAFCDDLDKICKICIRNGVNEKYLLNKVLECIFAEGHKIFDKILKSQTERLYHKIELLLPPNANLTPDAIIREYLETVPASEVFLSDLGELLGKFNFDVDTSILETKVAKMQEDRELENFEHKLEKPYRKLLPDFQDLTGIEFEDYVKQVFRSLGYEAVRTPSTRDQGADVLICKSGKKTVVQVKKYSGRVDNSAIQQVVASKPYYQADEATVITNSTFTPSAVELAKSNNVVLIDGEALKNMIQKIESGSVVPRAGLSAEIAEWVTREQLITDWIEDYEKLSKMEAFDRIDTNHIAYVDDFDEFLLKYIKTFAPVLGSIQTISVTEEKKKGLLKQVRTLGGIIDKLRKRFLFVYHFKANEIIKSGEALDGVDEAYHQKISSNLKLLNTSIYLALFLTNLTNLIKWLTALNEAEVDQQIINDRARKITLLFRDVLNAINQVARTYEILNKKLTNLENLQGKRQF